MNRKGERPRPPAHVRVADIPHLCAPMSTKSVAPGASLPIHARPQSRPHALTAPSAPGSSAVAASASTVSTGNKSDVTLAAQRPTGACESAAPAHPEKQIARHTWGRRIDARAHGRCARAYSCDHQTDRRKGRKQRRRGQALGVFCSIRATSVSAWGSQYAAHSAARLKAQSHTGAGGSRGTRCQSSTHRLPVSPNRRSHCGHSNGREPS